MSKTPCLDALESAPTASAAARAVMAVPRRWSFTLPIDLPSKNGVPRNRHAYKRWRDGLASSLAAAARQLGIPCAVNPPHQRGAASTATMVPRRMVTITRLIAKGGKRYDERDGLEGGAVALRDAMQKTRYRWKKGVEYPIGTVPGAGIVWDDSAKWSDWAYAQERSADGKAGVRIEVEDIEPAPPARSE